MNRLTLHNKIHFYTAALVALTLPLGKLTPIFISLILLNFIVEGNFKHKIKTLLTNKIAFLFIGFYLLHLIGMAYTENKASGGFDLQVKVSILLFPILFGSKQFNKQEALQLANAFIIGCFVACLFMFGNAVYWYSFKTANIDLFFYSLYSNLMHPSYMAMYLMLAIFILYFQLLNGTENSSAKRWMSIAGILFFSANIVLLSSKAGLISLIVFFIYVFIKMIMSQRIVIGISLLTILSAALLSTYHFSKPFQIRIQRAIAELSNTADPEKSQYDSTGVRLLIWKACGSVIDNNRWFGVGTGDSKDELCNEYQKRRLTDAYSKKLNAHNQFLETSVTLGLTGLVLLIANLIVPLYKSAKQSNFIYVGFLILIIINFTPEVMLSTQSGVMFYAFFNSLLCFNNFTAQHKTV